MMQIFSSPVTRFSKRMYRFILLAAFLTVMVGVSVCYSPLSAYAATSGSTASTPPTGFTPVINTNLSQLVGKNPDIHMETLTLSPATCTALNQASPGAAPTCKLSHYWTGTSYLALSQAASKVASSVAPGFWYWWAADQICSVSDPGTHDGCSWWGLSMTEDGVANGKSVWQWNHGCTAGGVEGTMDQGWCGYLFNGGGWPNYAMQFGLNGKSCLVTQWLTGCDNHGMRRWINDSGRLSTFYSW